MKRFNPLHGARPSQRGEDTGRDGSGKGGIGKTAGRRPVIQFWPFLSHFYTSGFI